MANNTKTILKLKELGLSYKEGQFYLAGLSLGVFSLSEIAKITGIKRPSCYLIAEQLVKKGLLAQTPSQKKRMYRAEPLDGVIKNLEEKLDTAKTVSRDIENIVAVQKVGTPSVRMYIGSSEIQNIWNMILDNKKTGYRFIGSTPQSIESAGEVFSIYFNNTADKFNLSREIIRTERNYDYSRYKGKGRKIWYAPKNFSMKDSILIFDNKVAIFSNTPQPYAVLFTGESLVDSMNSFFETVKSISDPE